MLVYQRAAKRYDGKATPRGDSVSLFRRAAFLFLRVVLGYMDTWEVHGGIHSQEPTSVPWDGFLQPMIFFEEAD